MLLAIDVGNSETKLGFYAANEAGALSLARNWRIETSSRRTPDEFSALFGMLLAGSQIAAARVRAVAISSVVPQLDRPLTWACENAFGATPRFFGAADQTLIEVTTERPRELGSDMLAAAVAAKVRFGAPLVVIGFGTATTFSAVSREGEFIGTAIAPGIAISIDALVERTAKLPHVALEAPNGPIGRDTVSAMQAGIVYGFVGQAEALVRRMRQAIGEDARVIATGGLAEAIARHSGVIDAVEPHLVLDGLRIYHEAVTAAGGRPAMLY